MGLNPEFTISRFNWWTPCEVWLVSYFTDMSPDNGVHITREMSTCLSNMETARTVTKFGGHLGLRSQGMVEKLRIMDSA